MDKAKPCCRRSAYCGECFELTRRDRKYCSRKCLKRKASETYYYKKIGAKPPDLPPVCKPYRPFVPQIDWSGKGGELVESE